MASKLSKEDKKFLITTAIYNRDFLLNIENIRLSMTIAITAAIVSVFSIVLTLKLVSPQIAAVVPTIVVLLVWLDWYQSNKKLVKRIYKIRGQYSKQLKELYSGLEDEELAI